MKRKLTKALSGILALAFAVFILGSVVDYQYVKAQDTAKTETIKVAYLPITHAVPLLALADSLKDGKSGIRIELVKYGSWPELMDALSSGQVDAASVLVELAIKAKTNGAPLQLAALGHRDGNIIVGSKSVNSAEDLRGKKVAIPSPQSSHYLLLRQYLKDAGLTADDVEWVELAPTEMPYALQSGQVDAYCVAEPFGSKAVMSGIGHVLSESDTLWPDSICCGLVWNTGWSRAHPDTAAAFLQDYLDEGNVMDDDTALQTANKYLNADKDTLTESLTYISFKALSIDRKAYENLTKKMKADGLNENPPAYEDFVYQGEAK